jgi:hypothetical protein
MTKEREGKLVRLKLQRLRTGETVLILPEGQ